MQNEHQNTANVVKEVAKQPQEQQGKPSHLEKEIECLLAELERDLSNLRNTVEGLRRARERQWPLCEVFEWVAMSDFAKVCEMLAPRMNKLLNLFQWEYLSKAVNALGDAADAGDADAISVKKIQDIASVIKDAVYRLMPKFPAEAGRKREVPF